MLDVWKESLSSKFNKNCVQREVWLVSDLVFLSATLIELWGQNKKVFPCCYYCNCIEPFEQKETTGKEKGAVLNIVSAWAHFLGQ